MLKPAVRAAGRVYGAHILPIHALNKDFVSNLNVGGGSAATTADNGSPRFEPISRHLAKFSCAVAVSKTGSFDPIPCRGVPFLSAVGVCHERYCRRRACFGFTSCILAFKCIFRLSATLMIMVTIGKVAAAVTGALSVLGW